jgi:immune inhibitor A
MEIRMSLPAGQTSLGRKRELRRWLWLLLAIALVACRGRQATPDLPVAQLTPTAVVTRQVAVETRITPAVAPSAPIVDETGTGTSGLAVEANTGRSPGEAAPARPLEWTAAEPDMQVTYLLLSQAEPPGRDDLELARAYLGWDGLLPTPPAARSLTTGTIQTLNVLNHERNTVEAVRAEILAVSEHAYFWFEDGPGMAVPSERELARAGELFDFIYEEAVAIFGPENRPGIDGDPRLHLVHASPATLCDTGPDENYQCSLAGYFSADDTLPAEIFPQSNGREMFVVNGRFFGGDFYFAVLAHELRHMIEDNYDRGDADWVVEGSAMLSEELVGFPGNGVTRANIFLRNPDQQLNHWTDGNATPYYGQAYLFNRFLYDRLGHEVYRHFAASPAKGLAAVDEVARLNGLELTGEGSWLDFLVSLAVHQHKAAPDVYRFGVDGLEQAAMTEVTAWPATFSEMVHQYGADYYSLSGDEAVTLHFQGSDLAPVLAVPPASGDFMWLSSRANYSHQRLTRSVDLRQSDRATLQYSVYHDIELGYDFAYLFVSQDGGRAWQALVAEGMQGLDPGDDPSGSALAPRFYSGRGYAWLQESVDLSPFAGQEILIRFAYVTDPILTFGGLALDDITIPELDFYDGAEDQDHGWLAEGFSRVTAAMPQRWHLQLITFPDDAPQVERLDVDERAEVTVTLEAAAVGNGAVLIIAAAAPMTLEQAAYNLILEPVAP